MAVDYTKVFTVAGKYLKYLNAYYAYIATYVTGQSAIETILSAQSLIRLEDGLGSMYDRFKQNISTGTFQIISRLSALFTDETLIGANFSFGQAPTLDLVWPALIHDMANNDKNVTANVITIGSITYDTENTTVGVIKVGTILDGVTSPMQGAPAILDYLDLTSQLVPDSETLTFTCTSDSESGGNQRGSETFVITGTGGGADPYSVTGENIGNLGTITVADNAVSQFVSNASFDSWTDSVPDGWEVTDGTKVTDFIEGAVTVTGEGSSIKTVQSDNSCILTATIPNSAFKRRKSYWLAAWVAKSTDIAGDGGIGIEIGDDNGVFNSLDIDALSTAWAVGALQFIPPIEIEGDVFININLITDATKDPTYIDQLVVCECEYHAGISPIIFGGPEKWLLGDQIKVPLSNNNAGVIQTLFRKAFKIQLPVDASPTISDSLAT